MVTYAEIKFKVKENKNNIVIPDNFECKLYSQVYSKVVGKIAGMANAKMDKLNEQAEALGYEGSFDMDAKYNVFMRAQIQRIADNLLIELYGDTCAYSDNYEYKYTFEIDKNFIWHMDIENIYGFKAELWTSELKMAE